MRLYLRFSTNTGKYREIYQNIRTRSRTCSNIHGRRDRAILFRCSYNIYINSYIYIMTYPILPVLLNIEIYIEFVGEKYKNFGTNLCNIGVAYKLAVQVSEQIRINRNKSEQNKYLCMSRYS